MTEISLERIQELHAEIDAINKANIRNLVITKDGKPIDLSTRMRDDLRFTGMSTFVLLRHVAVKQHG